MQFLHDVIGQLLAASLPIPLTGGGAVKTVFYCRYCPSKPGLHPDMLWSLPYQI